MWWWSVDPKKATTAIFVEYDPDFPSKSCILGIPIGVKGNRMTHTFRWPLGQVASMGEGRTIATSNERRRRT